MSKMTRGPSGKSGMWQHPELGRTRAATVWSSLLAKFLWLLCSLGRRVLFTSWVISGQLNLEMYVDYARWETVFFFKSHFSHLSFPAPFEGGTALSICSRILVLSSSYEEHPRSCGGGRLGSPFRNSLLCCANHTLGTFHILFLGAKHKESQHQQQFLWQPVSPPPCLSSCAELNSKRGHFTSCKGDSQ